MKRKIKFRKQRQFTTLPFLGIVAAAFILPFAALGAVHISQLLIPKKPADYHIFPDIPYTFHNKKPLLMDLCLPINPEKPSPVALLIHGGGWAQCDKDRYTTPRHDSPDSCEWNTIDLCQRLALEGIAAMSINYRPVTASPTTQFPAQLEDARAALAWIKQNAFLYRLDPTRIIAWGESAGGNLASLLGANGEVYAVVNEFGLQDLASPEYTQPEIIALIDAYAPTKEQKLAASPLRQLSNPVPFFSIHGQWDSIVPPSETERLHEKLREKGVRTETYLYDGGHGIPAELTETIFQKELTFVQSVLE